MMFYRSQFHCLPEYHALALFRPLLCLIKFHAVTLILFLTLLPTLDAMHLPAGSDVMKSARDTLGHSAGSKLSRRTVYNPRILSPDQHTLWTVGSTVTVTWDTRDIPQDITNDEGMVVLGYIMPGSTNEHLDLDRPLASGFDIRAGKVSFKVPLVPTRSDYIIVLFGDSGNHSPTFGISHP